MALTYADIKKWGLARLSDVASTILGSSTPAALGTAAAGSAATASRSDHVHQMPTAAQVNALGIPLAWNASTNSPTLASSTAPSGNNTYKVTVAGSTTLDGISSWAVDDLLYFDGTVWVKVPVTSGGVVHLTSYAATSAHTGVTTESAALKTVTLGALAAGTRVRVRFSITGGSSSDTTTTRIKLAGTTLVTLTTATFNNLNVGMAEIICTGSATQTSYGFLTAANGAVPTSVSSNAVQSTVNTASSVDLTVTLQNSVTTRSAVLAALDIEIAQP